MVLLRGSTPEVKFFIFGILISFICASKQDCIWYGVCNTDSSYHNQYCSYNGTPKEMPPDGLQLLAERCSFLLEEKQTKFCCDVDQVKILNKNIKLASAILDRCPSCMANLARHICEFSCSSEQSKFARVASTKKNDKGDDYVTALDLHITEEYINKTYKSCAQVSVPQTGQLALDLMCGTYGASRCSPTKWFTYMGDVNNVYVPFQITYIQHPTNSTTNEFTPLNPKTIPCNEAVNSELPACSCTDCDLSCPQAPEEPITPNQLKIAGFDAFTVIMTVVFTVGTVVFLLGTFLFTKDSISDEDFHVGNEEVTDDSMYRQQPRYFEKLGARTEYFLENIFTKWGTFFATYPWITLFACASIVVMLGYGITFVEITTDPVQLWASPSSKSRMEREFFDSKFEPFFRIEQVIIKAVDLPYILHNTSNGPIKFGPIFGKDFLSDVLDLQEQIQNIDANGTFLNNICYAPLKDDNSYVKASDCVIQSIWGYFQDDISRLDDNDEDNGFNS
ncbi:NPC intracellular cholesterol transporter 1 isoform X2 [Drosophila virilis]|uniref:NPC intracellular cholesterol transporter 1 isoform X2 n=1 Tax=Drosophila virilis TaxID=7244 RepID=UPI001396184E|nr:NPC intracellular cholesterol transporter 1 isoform X2 [Drosophila virilis]